MSPRELRFTAHALVRMRQRAITTADIEHLLAEGIPSRDPTWTPDQPTFRVTGTTATGKRVRIVFRRAMGEDVVITAIRL